MFDFEKLKKPFPADDIEWRLQSCGEKGGHIWAICLAYVTNRAIQNRLDEVVGPENWKNEFSKGPDGGILCGLSIKCGDEWVTKWDGAENTQIEAVKGGLSGAMKRAASTGWGIGRYLYSLEENFAEVSERGKFSGKTREGKWFRWNPPKLPDWALPDGDRSKNSELSPEAQKERELELENDFMKLKEEIVRFMNSGIMDQKQKDYINKSFASGDTDKLRDILAWCRSEEKKVG